MSKIKNISKTKPLIELPNNGFISKKELLLFLPFNGQKLFELSQESSFPKPYTVDDHIVFWDCEEVHQWFYRQKMSRKSVNTTEAFTELVGKTKECCKSIQLTIILKYDDTLVLRGISILKILFSLMMKIVSL